MHFTDLTPYCYQWAPMRSEILNVGWLSNEHYFCHGPVEERLMAILEELVAHPVNLFRGYHVCEFCPQPVVRYDAHGLPMTTFLPGTQGNGEIRLKGLHGQTYVAPAMVHHYVAVHGYCPPQEFLDAITRAGTTAAHPQAPETMRPSLTVVPSRKTPE
jgi:hypothetical protein